MKKYTTVFEKCSCEFVEKKSRFIGALFHAEDMAAAQEIIAAKKKEYWDASHNCSAYIIGETRDLKRFSDDGEPQGTAGMPMLEALDKSGLTDVVCIATRYFGGILLGAGGLVRAYTKCVAGAVAAAREKKLVTEMIPSNIYELTLPYSAYGKFENLAASGICVKEDAEFAENVKIILSVETEKDGFFKKEITEAFLGAAEPRFIEERYAKRILK